MAILLVFLNHIDSAYIVKSFPSFLQLVIATIFSSGLTGVSLLFILSGFLMAYIYPKPSDIMSFLQKRYTRIFPLFITMALAMAVFRNIPALNLGFRILTILFLASVTHFLWVYVIQKINNPKAGRVIFIGFLSLQIIIGLVYALVIMRKPAIVFNQLTPVPIRESMIALVNMTLTLPLGNYIPMLDGVYWSLVSEVFFYILYPLVYVPIISILSRQSRFFKILFIASLWPFILGFNQMAKRLLSLQMLNFTFFIYFVVGIALGYLLKKHGQKIHDKSKKLNRWANPLLFFIFIFFLNYSVVHTQGPIRDVARMLWSLPIILLVFFMLENSTSIARFFQTKFLVFLGIISYPLYLTHTSMVDGAHLLYRPSNTINDIVFILGVFLTTLLVSYALHYLLEQPYFIKQPVTPKVQPRFNNIPIRAVSFPIIILLIIAIFFAYQSNFNLLSMEKTFGREVFVSPEVTTNTKHISMHQYPQIDIKIKSPENNFGILVADLLYESRKQNPLSPNNDPQMLVFQIKPSQSTEWLSTSTYKPGEIGNSMHPFGFPLIEDAKNKEYDIRLRLTNPEGRENIILNLTKNPITTVNQLNKGELFKSPYKLLQLVLTRIHMVLKNSEVYYISSLFLPFLIFLLFLSFRNNR